MAPKPGFSLLLRKLRRGNAGLSSSAHRASVLNYMSKSEAMPIPSIRRMQNTSRDEQPTDYVGGQVMPQRKRRRVMTAREKKQIAGYPDREITLECLSCVRGNFHAQF